MKKLLVLLVLCTLSVQSQDNVALGMYQDPTLAFTNDGYGNTPFTLDTKITLEMNGKQFKHYYFSVRPEFEYAELSGGKYISYLVNTGWVFNQLPVERLSAGAYITGGFVERWGMSFGSYGLSSDISYGNRFKVSLFNQLLRAPDIVARWGDSKRYRFSTYLGIKIIL